MPRRFILSCAIAALAWLSSAAQAPLQFEVASIRLNTSGDRRASMRFTPAADLNASNQPFRTFIQFAYQLPLFRIEGLPDWSDSARFDIVAKAPAGLSLTPETRAQLLRHLLETRFKLKARLVTKDVPVMALVFARSDRRLGPKIRPSTVNCEVAVAEARARVAANAGVPVAGAPVCALGGMSAGPICGAAVTFEQLATGLSGVFQRPVIDRTGLAGRFDFDLTFTPDNPGGPGIAFGSICPSSVGADRPAFSTAMQEQLGLKLDPQRGPVDVLVIDSVELPAED